MENSAHSFTEGGDDYFDYKSGCQPNDCYWPTCSCKFPPSIKPSKIRWRNAIDLISQERQRQIKEEHYDAQHDDYLPPDALADAAAVYAMAAVHRKHRDYVSGVPQIWPFNPTFYKPCPNDRLKELIKAGALIAAEIDRILRSKS